MPRPLAPTSGSQRSTAPPPQSEIRPVVASYPIAVLAPRRFTPLHAQLHLFIAQLESDGSRDELLHWCGQPSSHVGPVRTARSRSARLISACLGSGG